MAEEVGALRVSLRANAAEIESDLGKVKSIVNSAAAQMQRSMVTFGKGVNGAIGEIFNLRNAMIGLAGGAFISLIKRSVQFGDSIGETADMIGISAKALQELRFAAGLAGVTSEEFDKSMMQLSKRLGEAQLEVNETSKALGRLGISMAEVKGKTADEVFKMVADRIRLIPDPMARAAIATDLFGKAGQKLLPTLMQGSEFLAKLAAEAHKAGLVLSDETLKKASDAADEFDKLGMALKVAGVNVSVGFLPAMTELRKLFTSPDFQEGVKNVAKNFGDMIKWMVDNKETILTITTAFAGLKVGAAAGRTVGGARGAIVGGVIGAATGAVAAQYLTAKEGVADLETEIALLESGIRSAFNKRSRENDQGMRDALTDHIGELTKTLGAKRAQLSELQKQTEAAAEPGPTKVEVRKAPLQVFPEVTEAIEKLKFQTREVRGDFDNLAPGFAVAANGLKKFGTEGFEAVTTVEKLHPQLQQLNDEMLALNAAKIIDGLKSSTEKYNEELRKLQMLHDANKLSAEKLSEAQFKLKFPTLSRAIDDARNFNMQMDHLATSGLNSTADALTDIATGAKSAEEAFRTLAQSVIRDLIQMTIKAMLFRAVSGFFGMADGGAAVAKAAGGPIMGPGSSRSDSIPAWLSNGEYVVNARATRSNLPLLNAINFGNGFADGGQVSPAMRMSAANDRMGQALTVHVSLDNDMLRAVVTDESGRQIAQAAPSIVNAATANAVKAVPAARRNNPKMFG